MTAKTFPRRATATGAVAALLIAVAPAAAAPALRSSETQTQTVTVVSVDHATRHLVVKTPAGETESIKVPEEVRSFEQLKPGDRIKATYSMEAEFSMSAAGKAAPPNSQTLLAARAGKPELPAGAIANHVVVTGAVLAVDNLAHTVKLVNPNGGPVHLIRVASPEGRVLLRQLKPGDKVTAEITESLLISTERPDQAG